MSDCLFCKIIEKNLPAHFVYEDEYCVAFNDIHPKAPVHVLVIPKKHVESLADLTFEDSHLMSHIVLQLPKIAWSQGLETGFRTVVNTGAGGGQEIYHLHFHLLGGGAIKHF